MAGEWAWPAKRRQRSPPCVAAVGPAHSVSVEPNRPRSIEAADWRLEAGAEGGGAALLLGQAGPG